MRQLTVLYDPECGLCRRVREWLIVQPKYVDVIGDDGGVYWGAKAWLMCLWALKQYREWSYRLSAPELLPTARRVVSMISQNRHKLEVLGKVLMRDSG